MDMQYRLHFSCKQHQDRTYQSQIGSIQPNMSDKLQCCLGHTKNTLLNKTSCMCCFLTRNLQHMMSILQLTNMSYSWGDMNDMCLPFYINLFYILLNIDKGRLSCMLDSFQHIVDMMNRSWVCMIQHIWCIFHGSYKLYSYLLYKECIDLLTNRNLLCTYCTWKLKLDSSDN